MLTKKFSDLNIDDDSDYVTLAVYTKNGTNVEVALAPGLNDGFDKSLAHTIVDSYPARSEGSDHLRALCRDMGMNKDMFVDGDNVRYGFISAPFHVVEIDGPQGAQNVLKPDYDKAVIAPELGSQDHYNNQTQINKLVSSFSIYQNDIVTGNRAASMNTRVDYLGAEIDGDFISTADYRGAYHFEPSVEFLKDIPSSLDSPDELNTLESLPDSSQSLVDAYKSGEPLEWAMLITENNERDLFDSLVSDDEPRTFEIEPHLLLTPGRNSGLSRYAMGGSLLQDGVTTDFRATDIAHMMDESSYVKNNGYVSRYGHSLQSQYKRDYEGLKREYESYPMGYYDPYSKYHPDEDVIWYDQDYDYDLTDTFDMKLYNEPLDDSKVYAFTAPLVMNDDGRCGPDLSRATRLPDDSKPFDARELLANDAIRRKCDALGVDAAEHSFDHVVEYDKTQRAMNDKQSQVDHEVDKTAAPPSRQSTYIRKRLEEIHDRLLNDAHTIGPEHGDDLTR